MYSSNKLLSFMLIIFIKLIDCLKHFQHLSTTSEQFDNFRIETDILKFIIQVMTTEKNNNFSCQIIKLFCSFKKMFLKRRAVLQRLIKVLQKYFIVKTRTKTSMSLYKLRLESPSTIIKYGTFNCYSQNVKLSTSIDSYLKACSRAL